MADSSEDLDRFYDNLDGLPATPEGFADFTDTPLSAVREVARSLKIPKFGNSYAISRASAEAVIEELESLGYFDDDCDDEGEDSHEEG